MGNNITDILLFKTNISTAADKHILQATLDRHPQILQWQVDLEDKDHVLRIISPTMAHETIIDMIKLNGYRCEELKD